MFISRRTDKTRHSEPVAKGSPQQAAPHHAALASQKSRVSQAGGVLHFLKRGLDAGRQAFRASRAADHEAARPQPAAASRPLAAIPKAASGEGFAGVTDPPDTAPLKGVDLARNAVLLTDALLGALTRFLKVAAPRFGHHRSAAVARADTLLRPLANRSTLERQDLLTLLDASALLQGSSGEGRSGRHAAAMEDVVREINRFVGSGPELKMGVERLGSRLEKEALVPVFSEYFRRRYPHLLRIDPESGRARLTDEGTLQYGKLKQKFERTSQNRHVVTPIAAQMTPSERLVSKLMGSDYLAFQSALRAPDSARDAASAMALRKSLIECARIVEELARATPEQVTRQRKASLFPGGVTDPRELVAGQVYKEDGFVVVGGEPAADKAVKMNIRLTRGYPVDTRAFYRKASSEDKKIQWFTLPGAEFRYEGAHDENGDTTYEFTQVTR